MSENDPVPDFEFWVGDDNVPMAFTVTDAFGSYIDITGATVTLHVGPLNETVAAVDLVGSVAGTTPQTKAQYLWRATDLGSPQVPGDYQGNFLIQQPAGGERITWPPDRSLLIRLNPQVP